MPVSLHPHLVTLAVVETLGARAAGGKAYNLGRLFEAGLPVPDGYCIVAEAYRAHMTRGSIPELVERIGPGDPTSVETSGALGALRQAIVQLPIDPDLGQAIATALGRLPAKKLAVRSSATLEDAPGQSFAGQFDTCLGVRGHDECMAAVRRCWASVWSERAVAYRRRHGILDGDLAMAVLIQSLVPARLSGVAFTADPVTGDRSRIVVEAAPGIGEVVATHTTPDRYVLDATNGAVLERSAGVHDVTHGARTTPQAPCLEAPQLEDLADLAHRACATLGSTLDLEWAVEDRDVVLLQARPITAIPGTSRAREAPVPETGPEDRQIWTNANAGEVVPDVVTPMTWSIVEQMIGRLMNSITGWAGFDLAGAPVLGLVAGRIYFNLNTLIGLGRATPALLQRDVSELFGGSPEHRRLIDKIAIDDIDIPDVRMRPLRAARQLPATLYGFFRHGPRRGAAYIEAMRHRTLAFRDVTLGGLDERELLDRIHREVDALVDDEDSFLFMVVGMTWVGMLYGLCERWFPGDGDATANGLLAGIGDMDHAEAGLDLWRLARVAEQDTELRALLAEDASFDALQPRLARAPDGEAFLEKWRDFMFRHGHHTRGEIELSNPRWSESPEEVLGLVRSSLDGLDRVDPLQKAEAVAREHAVRLAACRGRLGPLRRWMLGFVLKRARRGAPIRENLKSEIVRRIAFLRAMMCELGGRLARSGTVARADDIFFVTIEELTSFVAHPQAMTETVASRRRSHEENERRYPPSLVVGRYRPETHDEAVEATDIMSGLAVSPGAVSGPARVILRSGADYVRPGEILVAPFTDPGWSPYFLNAAAIVTDMGGLLSHGSIIAREYGIPCVANVGPATRLIKTGQIIRVDGTKGIVEIASD